MLARVSALATFALGALLAVNAAAAAGREVPLAWAAVMTDAPPPAASRGPELELLREAAALLIERSPTFREMLDVIAAAPHLRMGILAVTDVSPRLGTTGFHVHGPWTYGVMNINMTHRDPKLRARAIAHEVAHAAEVACLPPAASTKALLHSLRPRRGVVPLMEQPGETPFAMAAEQAVMREYLRRAPDSGGVFIDLAARFALQHCAALRADSVSE